MTQESLPEDVGRQITDMQQRILGAPLEYTREQVATDAAVPLEAARVLWRSMGYADVGEAVAFTGRDKEALHRMLQQPALGGTVDRSAGSGDGSYP